MVITKLEDVTRQGLKKTPSSGKSLINTYSFLGVGVEVVAYLSLSGSGREVGRGGHLFEAGRLFEVGANSMLGAYSNKYGISN